MTIFVSQSANDMHRLVLPTNLETVRYVASQIKSGQVHLNYPPFDPRAPFGGFKQSGNGREYGVEGLKEYLEVKSILGYFHSAEA